MNSKILLLSVAVIAVGLFAMPSTLSLFAGQHTFDDGASVQCSKCHEDIYEEMSGSGQFGSSTTHNDPNVQACEGCHRVSTSTLTVPIGKNPDGTKVMGTYNRANLSGAHAAVTMECVGCHVLVPTELTNGSEAHRPYYNNASVNGILKGANEACVGCHTHTNINATWRRSVGMDLTVYENQTGGYTINMVVNNGYNQTKTNSVWVATDGQNP